jgi:hypothetical protein
MVIGEGRFFHTSHVQKIEVYDGFDIITTLNSTYKVIPLDIIIKPYTLKPSSQ